MRSSRKARSIAENPNVSVCIQVRRVPVGPPSSLQFAATATLLAVDDPEITDLVSAGALGWLTSHGELELAGSCFVRIVPSTRINCYGLGMSLRDLVKDPLHAAGVADLSSLIESSDGLAA